MSNRFSVSRCCCELTCPGCGGNNNRFPYRTVILKNFTSDGPYYNPVYHTYTGTPALLDKQNFDTIGSDFRGDLFTNIAPLTFNNYTSTQDFFLSGPLSYQYDTGYKWNLGTNHPRTFFPYIGTYNLYQPRGYALTAEKFCRYERSSYYGPVFYEDQQFLKAGTFLTNIPDDRRYYDSLDPYYSPLGLPLVPNPRFSISLFLSCKVYFAKNPTIYSQTYNPIPYGTIDSHINNPRTSVSIFSNIGNYMIVSITLTHQLTYFITCSDIPDIFNATYVQQEGATTILYDPISLTGNNCCGSHTLTTILDRLQDSYSHQFFNSSIMSVGVESSLGTSSYIGPTSNISPTIEIQNCG